MLRTIVSVFFKYDYMVKVCMHMHNARKVVKVNSLTKSLNAALVSKEC